MTNKKAIGLFPISLLSFFFSKNRIKPRRCTLPPRPIAYTITAWVPWSSGHTHIHTLSLFLKLPYAMSDPFSSLFLLGDRQAGKERASKNKPCPIDHRNCTTQWLFDRLNTDLCFQRRGKLSAWLPVCLSVCLLVFSRISNAGEDASTLSTALLPPGRVDTFAGYLVNARPRRELEFPKKRDLEVFFPGFPPALSFPFP